MPDFFSWLTCEEVTHQHPPNKLHTHCEKKTFPLTRCSVFNGKKEIKERWGEKTHYIRYRFNGFFLSLPCVKILESLPVVVLLFSLSQLFIPDPFILPLCPGKTEEPAKCTEQFPSRNITNTLTGRKVFPACFHFYANPLCGTRDCYAS